MKPALFLFSLLFIGSVHAAKINEIRVDQDGSDTDEYIELAGAANESLAGLSIVVIGDGNATTQQGVIEDIESLDGQVINSTGFFTLAESSFFTNATADATVSLNFENSQSTTFLLVSGLSNTAASGDDLDTDDDGTFETKPWASIIDSVSIVSSQSDDIEYSSTLVGPDDDSSSPEHIFLCDDGFRIGLDAFTDDIDDDFDTPTLPNKCGGMTGGGDPATPRTISEIQSDQAASPFAGEAVVTTGVVTADFQGGEKLRGFYIQDPTGDANDNTSDGIYVFEGDDIITEVNVGDNVTVVATITEFFGLTELNNVTSITVNSSGNVVPEPISISLPESVDGELEKYEGMLVSVDGEMTVSQTVFLGRFGQLTLASPDDEGVAGRLFQPTNQFAAGSPEAIALADENARRTLILDDGQDINTNGDNPAAVPYLGGPPATTVIRSGDRVSNLVGVLDFGRITGRPFSSDYRLHPVQAPVFTAVNQREEAPSVAEGDLKVASFNVLNFFTTLESRGADTNTELVRQESKLVRALVAMDADIVGLIEVENNGLGAGSAVRRLVDAINTELGSIEYDVLPVGSLFLPIGTDQITVAFIYKPASVTPVGTVAKLTTGAFDQTLSDGGRSRQPIAASFRDKASSEVFTAVINHLKSKRAPGSVQNNGNDDQGDGQGSWNLRRTEAAKDLVAWLATNPTEVDDPDMLIMGDLNAYAKEDPIQALLDEGFEDLVNKFEGNGGYSFTFGGQAGYLDHALGSASMAAQVSGVTTWHINSDEPQVLDYNEEFNSAPYYDADPFRSSDHDPTIVSLKLGQKMPSDDQTCYVIKAASANVVTFCL